MSLTIQCLGLDYATDGLQVSESLALHPVARPLEMGHDLLQHWAFFVLPEALDGSEEHIVHGLRQLDVHALVRLCIER